MTRLIIGLSELAVTAGASACGGSSSQNPTQSQAYRYGEFIGGMTLITG